MLLAKKNLVTIETPMPYDQLGFNSSDNYSHNFQQTLTLYVPPPKFTNKNFWKQTLLCAKGQRPCGPGIELTRDEALERFPEQRDVQHRGDGFRRTGT